MVRQEALGSCVFQDEGRPWAALQLIREDAEDAARSTRMQRVVSFYTSWNELTARAHASWQHSKPMSSVLGPHTLPARTIQRQVHRQMQDGGPPCRPELPAFPLLSKWCALRGLLWGWLSTGTGL